MLISNPADSQGMKKNYNTKSHREMWLKYRESWESDLNIQTMRMLTGRNIQGVRYSLISNNWEYSYKENGYEKTETLNFNKIQIYPQGGLFLNKKDKKNERYRFVNFMVDSLSEEINEKVICYLSRRVNETTDSYTLFFTEKGTLKHRTIELLFMELRFKEEDFEKTKFNGDVIMH